MSHLNVLSCWSAGTGVDLFGTESRLGVYGFGSFSGASVISSVPFCSFPIGFYELGPFLKAEHVFLLRDA